MQRQSKDDLVKDAAAERIFARRDALLAEQRSLKRQQSELAVREREIDRDLAECRAAARFFGIEFEPPGLGLEIHDLQARIHSSNMQMREAISRNSRQEVMMYQERIAHFQNKLRDLVVRREQDESQSTLVLLDSDETSKKSVTSMSIEQKPKIPKVRDIALDRLREAGEAGQKASAIQKYIENTYSTKIHDKTVGMTLYRLLQSKLVHRKGQIWFYGPSSLEDDTEGKESPDTDVSGLTQKVFEAA